MKDRSQEPSAHALQKEISRILSDAAQDSPARVSNSSPTWLVRAPGYALWRGAGLILAIIGAWPVELSKLFHSFIFVAACSCTLIALIKCMRLPNSNTTNRSRKAATLHRVR